MENKSRNELAIILATKMAVRTEKRTGKKIDIINLAIGYLKGVGYMKPYSKADFIKAIKAVA